MRGGAPESRPRAAQIGVFLGSGEVLWFRRVRPKRSEASEDRHAFFVYTRDMGPLNTKPSLLQTYFRSYKSLFQIAPELSTVYFIHGTTLVYIYIYVYDAPALHSLLVLLVSLASDRSPLRWYSLARRTPQSCNSGERSKSLSNLITLTCKCSIWRPDVKIGGLDVCSPQTIHLQ